MEGAGSILAALAEMIDIHKSSVSDPDPVF
jgi:hypothetical protein